MTTAISPRRSIMDISLYKGGDSTVAGQSNIVKLSSNENPFGPPDAAKDAVARAVHELHRYPSTDHASLRQAIAEVHGLDAARIICGVGSDEIIHFLCQAYIGDGGEVIHTEHGFAMYRISTLANGGTPVEVKERERVTDVDAILAACTDRTRLVFIANPNNPTGTMIGQAEITRLAEGIPPQAILVLDGAYAEYVEGFDAGAAMVEARDNVVMTRTFSKIYGLGGLRVGWGYAPMAIIDVLNRVRGPFNLSSPALAAAEAAVRDVDFVARCRAENARCRDWMANALAELGIPSDTSTANFVLARFASEAEANACDDHLRSEGILVRRVAGYKLPNCLRITVGDESACRRTVHAIAQFKAGNV
ncbi:histidinol-phosphate aminotransferase [Loktanella sp. 3ANDIMAR09]|uniref:histidinol-phosphate transaminase n=1 Tax=Loktanella sp. 3ANDIMAR09 TaxID=1225657 RepID=UPI0006F7C550|nr:histidinol-phosphate transaminase [Loktanella sp. 3ANDIMAR09]KQI69295.1 histidinol-phosphate aminotransferase [Loktanella sp. 3ANDIMAR09]